MLEAVSVPLSPTHFIGVPSDFSALKIAPAFLSGVPAERGVIPEDVRMGIPNPSIAPASVLPEGMNLDGTALREGIRRVGAFRIPGVEEQRVSPSVTVRVREARAREWAELYRAAEKRPEEMIDTLNQRFSELKIGIGLEIHDAENRGREKILLLRDMDSREILQQIRMESLPRLHRQVEETMGIPDIRRGLPAGLFVDMRIPAS